MVHYRQPIVSVLAHVDHGKTSLLDYIRNSTIAKKEAGGITQHIGASEISKESLLKMCSGYMKEIDFDGLLFLDTPGHEAFSYLREKGGSLADICILVIDITEGLKPQTIECIQILKNNKTPFCIAANKIDKITGWENHQGCSFTESFNKQEESVKKDFELKMYQLVGTLYEHGFNVDLFSRVTSFETTIALIPISARTGEGVIDLMSILVGLASKYLKENLKSEISTDRGEGVILEAKETIGIGKTIDVILYDGCISKKDTIIAGTKNGEPVVSKVKAILKEKIGPKKENAFCETVSAATGVKISAIGLDEDSVGFPVVFLKNDKKTDEEIAKMKSLFSEELKICPDEKGIIIKADTLGSIHALCGILKNKNIKIKSAEIGNAKKEDIALAEVAEDKYKVIVAYNTAIPNDIETLAKEKGIKIIRDKVIYHLIEQYELFAEELKKTEKSSFFKKTTLPFKIKFMPQCMFRKSHPFIGGFEVLGGTARTDVQLMDEQGNAVGKIDQIQANGKNIHKAEKEEKVAISSDYFNYEKNIREKDIFYPFLNNETIDLIKNKISAELDYLSEDEKKILAEIEKIKRKKLFES
ncbi:MAG: translation initiation factor IF-2 [Candidatus Aenigmarchaeota archaeon]|nr:translation initiation factor IF-2 [Candidatus Aenigmarchaeota archaeon]